MRLPSSVRFLWAVVLTTGTALATLGSLPAPAAATVFDDIGYTLLQSELGTAMPTGAGVGVSQIEAGISAYIPDKTIAAEFGGKTFTQKSGFSVTSNHATTVAQDFYGDQSGIAPGITSVNLWEMDAWVGTGFLRTGTTAAPAAETMKIENASWIDPTLGSTAQDVDALRRFDYVINTNKVVAVVAANDGSSSTLPNLLMQSYNSISVGLSNGNHSAGYTTIDGAGRIKPDLVVPTTATSWATPIVSGAAALLLQQATKSSLSDAQNPAAIKAILMAGATTNTLSSYSITPTQPLDLVYGAGQLNVDNSYHILTAGEQHASSSSLVSPEGWDYNTTSSSGNYYYFTVPAGTALSQLDVLLTWNRVITNGAQSGFSPVSSLANLNLKLYSANGFTLGTMLDSSVSAVDNVQHLYLTGTNSVLPAGTYALQVSSATAGAAYALAWRDASIQIGPLVGDLNGDGMVNNFDIDPFTVALTDPATYLSEYPTMTNYATLGDVNGNGVFDNFDIAPFITLLGASSSSPVPEPSSFVLLGLGGLGLLVARWRRAGCR